MTQAAAEAMLLVARFDAGPPPHLVLERMQDLTAAQKEAVKKQVAANVEGISEFLGLPRHRRTIKNPTSAVASVKTIKSTKPTSVVSVKPTMIASAPAPASAPASAPAPAPRPAFLSDVKWSDNKIDQRTLRALTETMGFEYMSKVQAASLAPALEGKNLFVKGKTGGGKTVGFLVPTIEQIATSPPPQGHIGALIVSHNRDLANQLHEEAEKLLTFHDIKAQVVIGGEPIGKQQRKLESQRADILIGTPGRLVDHIESTPGFLERLSTVRVLVLDEADELLDSGFKKALDTIVGALPPQHQTLFFSATVSDAVKQTANEYMKPSYEFIDTVGEDTEQTNVKVPQEYVVAPFEQSTVILYDLIAHHTATTTNPKIIVFFPTAKETSFMAALFNHMGIRVSEMHSRLTQSQRNRISEEFKHTVSGIMFASDVLARGFDAENVTYVIQVGLPDSVQQSVHRVGRTGRAGKEGSGVIILSPEEAKVFLPELEKLGVPISASTAGSTITGGIISGQNKYEIPEQLASAIADISTVRDLRRDAEQAYQAMLGYYNGHTKRMKITKADMVAMCNRFFLSNGLKELPSISKKTLSKMGLVGVEGIQVGAAVRNYTMRRGRATRQRSRRVHRHRQ